VKKGDRLGGRLRLMNKSCFQGIRTADQRKYSGMMNPNTLVVFDKPSASGHYQLSR